MGSFFRGGQPKRPCLPPQNLSRCPRPPDRPGGRLVRMAVVRRCRQERANVQYPTGNIQPIKDSSGRWIFLVGRWTLSSARTGVSGVAVLVPGSARLEPGVPGGHAPVGSIAPSSRSSGAARYPSEVIGSAAGAPTFGVQWQSPGRAPRPGRRHRFRPPPETACPLASRKRRRRASPSAAALHIASPFLGRVRAPAEAKGATPGRRSAPREKAGPGRLRANRPTNDRRPSFAVVVGVVVNRKKDATETRGRSPRETADPRGRLPRRADRRRGRGASRRGRRRTRRRGRPGRRRAFPHAPG